MPVSDSKISIIIPLLDEAESIVELHRQICDVADNNSYDLQILFIDDGSTDLSWTTIEELARRDSRVQAVRFRRNFGKAAALAAGFELATAPFVITMDADLQDDPAEIPKLIARLDGDANKPPVDVASGWKFDRKDPWHKTFPSKCFNLLVSWLTKVSLHDHNCGLKAYRNEVVKEINLYGELHRFVPVLADAKGYRVAEVTVNHRPRAHGQSKYGMKRLVKGFLDLITVKILTGYGDRPHHLIGGFGLASFILGSLGLVYLAIRWLLSRSIESWEVVHLHETASLYYSLALCLVGSQFLSVGVLASLFASYYADESKPYSVRETIGVNDNSPSNP